MEIKFDSAIIHISDLHYGPKYIAEQRDIIDRFGGQEGYGQVRQLFIDDVNEIIQAHKLPSEKIGLVISGDIAEFGKENEFAKAEEDILQIRKALSIPRSQVAMVPGNHDVNWDDCKNIALKTIDISKPITEDTKDKLRKTPEKLKWFSDSCEKICGKKFAIQEPVHFQSFEKLGVAIIGFDSTYPSLWTEADNYGGIQKGQQKVANDLLVKAVSHNNDLIPFAIIHHSLTPDPKDKNSYLRDAEEFKSFLKNSNYEYVLCGHEHSTKNSSSLDGELKILVTGSYGLNIMELLKGYAEGKRPETNKYQIILINHEGIVKVIFRRFNRIDDYAKIGKWGEDFFEGESSKLTYAKKFNKIIITKDLPTFEIKSINVPKKPSDASYWITAMHIFSKNKQAIEDIKSVSYRIDPENIELKSDPSSCFLATYQGNSLRGQCVSANVVLKSGITIDNIQGIIE